MDMVGTLANRYSSPLLQAPAPSETELQQLYEGMMRVPDHARLRPMRFQVWEGSALDRMGQIFVDYALRSDPDTSEEAIDRARSRPLRAPMIITVIASPVEHPKVPPVEQVISAGCSAYALLLGLDALGYGGMWRTGPIAYDEQVLQELGLSEGEQLIGFIYTGTPRERSAKAVEPPAFSERVAFIKN